MILGADIGHKNTKICYGLEENRSDIFKSTVMVNDLKAVTEDKPLVVEINNSQYAVGSKYGTYSIEEDKSTDDIFKVCLLTGIAKVVNNQINKINLVTGLPINYYKKYRSSVEDTFAGSTNKVKIGDHTCIFNIDTVDVYPESVGAILVSNEPARGASLIIDIGGSTVDVSYYEDTKLVKAGSYDLGMLTLYATIIKYINGHFGVDYKTLAAEDIIKRKFIQVDNECVDFDCSRFMKEHTEDLLSRIRLEFPWKTSRKRFIGGGSLDLLRPLEEITGLTLKTSYSGMFLNARAFYIIGDDKYGRQN